MRWLDISLWPEFLASPRCQKRNKQAFLLGEPAVVFHFTDLDLKENMLDPPTFHGKNNVLL